MTMRAACPAARAFPVARSHCRNVLRVKHPHGKILAPGHWLQARAFVTEKAPGGHCQPGAAERELIVLDFNELAAGKDLSAEIEQAYGPDGLGALVIKNVPGFVQHRGRLLRLADVFARLPEAVKSKYEDVASLYNVGWSHGRESLESGRPDTHKGSYYGNPLVDDQLNPKPGDVLKPWLHDAIPSSASPTHITHTSDQQQQQHPASSTTSTSIFSGGGGGLAAGGKQLSEEEAQQLRRLFPGYYRSNVWPTEELPELEEAFKQLGRLVCAAGCLLAVHCDRYVSSRLGTPPGEVAGVLHRSLNPKARLLHYFPVSEEEQTAAQPTSAPPAAEGGALAPVSHEEPWCGWHSDHGSLTGLTAAMYIDSAGNEVPCPDPTAGLYIRDRQGRVVRAVIPPDCLAFQVGEALQVHSGGLLMATPHYVRAARGPGAAGVSRNTFAVFMQPNVMESMECPPGVEAKRVAIGQWRPGLTFGEFAEATFDHYYKR
ncbi:hypothetical protein Agub_g7990 [Astrephomene gubernaculifera]|uniref:Uncharacterized protein n=1 Tax=Astrephomene gubernaculifera TaxID=47775 RepID=A0AAD3DR96_9CHLO|nr:hypothetical protein Agub_g7990 [Astrephomene gubernaculifera]